MELHFNELPNNIRLIELQGRLDVQGVHEIDIKFAGYCAGDQPRIIVDLTRVDYLASIGIQIFVMNAKSLRTRKGKMVLLNPTPEVFSVLEITHIHSIIPIYSNLESAEAVLLGS